MGAERAVGGLRSAHRESGDKSPHSIVAALALLAMGCVVQANPVLEWNEAFIRCVQRDMPSPCLAARNLALLHVSMHLAILDAQRAGRDEAEIAGAADGAGDEVCRLLFPSHAAEFDRLQAARSRRVTAKVQAAARLKARALLAARGNDGASTEVAYIPSHEPGQWRRTEPRLRPPEMPRWGKTKPFVITSGAQFRAVPPPALASEEYAQEVAGVQRLGGADSRERTEEQTLVAKFWSDFSYTSTPPGHWNHIARDIARQRQMPLAETARLFALLNVAMSDAGVAVWETKYYYNLWRPITAIRRATEDGNAATLADEKWMSLLPSPPHPEYVSGHAGFSGAAARILASQLGSDAVEFVAMSDSVPGVTRRFASLDACAEEIARSRVFGGIHYGISGRRGLELGRQVAAWTLEHFHRLEAPLPATASISPPSPAHP
jgi:hypothetical protein